MKPCTLFFLATIISLASTSTLAQVPSTVSQVREISANSKEGIAYTNAVTLALSESKLICRYTPQTVWERLRGKDTTKISKDRWIKDTVRFASAIAVNESGLQPFLTFFSSTSRTYNSTNLYSVTVVTSDDFRSIVGVTYKWYSTTTKEVNLGNLKSPELSNTQVVTEVMSATCK